MAAAAIPAIGAVMGGVMAKKNGMNPLFGAAMGGMGGHLAGPMLSGMAGGLGGAAAGNAVTPAMAAMQAAGPSAQGVAMEAMAGGVNPVMAAKMAGMSPNTIFGLANPTVSGMVGSPAQSAGIGLLGSGMSNPQKAFAASQVLGSMAKMATPQQAQMMAPPPPQMAMQQRPGSMASLGIGQSMYQPRRTTFG